MASTPVQPRRHYGSASPAILSGFEPETDTTASPTAVTSASPPIPLAQSSSAPQTPSRRGYPPINPALLDGPWSALANDMGNKQSRPAARRSAMLASSDGGKVARDGPGIHTPSTSNDDDEPPPDSPSRRSSRPLGHSGIGQDMAQKLAWDEETMGGIEILAAMLPSSDTLDADDAGLGLQYQFSTRNRPVFSNVRVPAEPATASERECIVCVDSKPSSAFPPVAITTTCTHPPATCRDCVASSIRSDLDTRLWNDVRCPECREPLRYDDVQRYADPQTRERYETLSFRYNVSQTRNFRWCACDYGQVHEGGIEQPIVSCLRCGRRSCFFHEVAWHENLTCAEYDSLLADPINFRSRFDLENEAAEREAADRRAQEDADHAFAQSLAAHEERVEAQARQERARREKEQARARERAVHERRQREEKARRDAARRKAEEDQSLRLVGRTSKRCPGCGWAIEKNEGCQHMTCIKCKHEFCWDCLADHHLIMKSDNSLHLPACPWHSSNRD